MPLAVLGSVVEGNGDAIGSLDYYAAAIEKDPKNTTAWLWQGIRYKSSGFFDDAIVSFEQCLAIDFGYQNCRQYMAEAYLIKGEVETAVNLHNETPGR